MVLRSLTLSLCLVLAACAGTPVAHVPQPAPAPATAAPDFLASALQRDGIIIGGQPLQTDFARLAEGGVTRVFNLRSAGEMSALGFDEAEVVRAAGLGYVHAPVDSGAAYTPELLEAFAREMESGSGNLLLHCAVGGRAGQLYAAWLVRYRGWAPDVALREVASLGAWPLPMERMLGTPLRLELAPVAN